jgi:hypothetical protein
VFFTYFYTAIQFDPVKQAEMIQRQGGFIPGVRPGRQTEQLTWPTSSTGSPCRVHLPGDHLGSACDRRVDLEHPIASPVSRS